MTDWEHQPAFVAPMLLRSGVVPEGDQWALEIKWDGCRAQLRYDTHSVSLRTRHGRECTAEFPEMADIAGALGKHRVTLDGELVCLRPDGRPDFHRLRRRLTGSVVHRHPAMLQIFDILHLDGRSTRALPYAERRAILDELALDGSAWRTPASIVAHQTERFVSRVTELGLEGVVAKRLGSRYLPGRRSPGWIKCKFRRDERLVVTGVRRKRDGRPEAVLVARHHVDGSVVPVGSIELGLTSELVESLERRLADLPARHRRAAVFYPAGQVSVIASLHGRSDGPVRDAILRHVPPAGFEVDCAPLT